MIASSAFGEDKEASRDFFFSGSDSLPSGWKLSRTDYSLKEFNPNYLAFNGNTIQRINLIPSDIVEKVSGPGNALHYTQDGRYVTVLGTLVDIVIHYRFSETAQKGYFYDFLTNVQETLQDPSKRLSKNEALIGRFQDEGVKNGYVSVDLGDSRWVNFECSFVKGNWWVEVHLNTPNPKELQRLQEENIARAAKFTADNPKWPAKPEPVSQEHGDEAMLRFFASHVAAQIPPDENVPKLLSDLFKQGVGVPATGQAAVSSRAAPGGESATLSEPTVAIAVAGGSIVMSIGAFLQLAAMGGFQNIRDLKSTFGSLFNLSDQNADMDLADLGIDDSPPPDTGPPPPKPKVNKPSVEPKPAQPASVAPAAATTPVQIPDPIPSGFEYQGKVWYQPPWDSGGPYWMSKADYDRMRDMMRQGKEWSNRWGWVDKGEAAKMDQARDQAFENFKKQDPEIKKITDGIKATQNKIDELKHQLAQSKIKAEIEAARERLQHLEKERDEANSLLGQAKLVKEHFMENAKEEYNTLPGYVNRVADDLSKKAKELADSVKAEVTDPANYKALAEAAGKTAADLMRNPLDSTKKVVNLVDKTAKVGGTIAGTIVGAAEVDPVGFVKGMIGIDNWEKALDRNVPLGERMARAVYGSVDMVLNFGSGGSEKAAQLGAEAGLDAARAAKGADAALGGGKIVNKIDDLTRQAAWEAGQRGGVNKVNALEEALKSGDPDKIRKAVLDVKTDKHAIWEINKRPDDLKGSFNGEIKQITDKADAALKDGIAQKYGIDSKQVEIIEAKNKSSEIKVGSDRDLTVRVPAKEGSIVPDPENPGKWIKVGPGQRVMVDVPSKEAGEIYHPALYDAAGGKSYAPHLSPEEFSSKAMDHVPVARMDAEAIGRSAKDTDVIMNRPGMDLSDAQQAGQISAYKGQHLFQQAEELQKINPEKAEMLHGEGMRQLAKQYDKLVDTRMNKLAELGHDIPVDTKLAKAVGILKQTQSGLSPMEAEKMLKGMGMTKDDVAQSISSQIERLQSFRTK